MIRGDDDFIACLWQLAEEVGDDGMAEPRERDAAIGRLVLRLPQQLQLLRILL